MNASYTRSAGLPASWTSRSAVTIIAASRRYSSGEAPAGSSQVQLGCSPGGRQPAAASRSSVRASKAGADGGRARPLTASARTRCASRNACT